MKNKTLQGFLLRITDSSATIFLCDLGKTYGIENIAAKDVTELLEISLTFCCVIQALLELR